MKSSQGRDKYFQQRVQVGGASGQIQSVRHVARLGVQVQLSSQVSRSIGGHRSHRGHGYSDILRCHGDQ
jgi:hypothetical protein